MKKRVVILGSTGSIGTSALKVARDIPERMEVVALAAFGFEKKTVKRLRLNIRSMSDVDIRAQYRYMEPKRSVSDLAFVDTWGNLPGAGSYRLEVKVQLYTGERITVFAGTLAI